jgi:5-oxoprolinase (ATP-hydrolysing)
MYRQWEFWIDRGGTFTDVVGRAPDGALRTCKLLSADPARYSDAALAGIRRLLDVPADAPIPTEEIDSVRVGTTVATNALLERRGEPTALVITAGFTDALLIGRQHRPHIFARRIVRPEPLYARVIAFEERIAADGTVLLAPNIDRLRADLQAAAAAGIGAVAIACLHAHLYPEHELLAAATAAEVGFGQISCSSSTNPLLRVLPRAATTVVDAYLSPVVRRYLDAMAAQLPGVRLLVMTSHGGLAEPAAVHGKDVVLSGPAGGIVGMARLAQSAGYPAVIGFDMGGTSTDVSHWAGEFERRSDNHVAGVDLRTPMLAIRTIAAGGGSLLQVTDGRLRVGPRSAGAEPGPLSYGRGGPLTLTDANVLLGLIQPAHFPAVFGPDGTAALDRDAVRVAFDALARDFATDGTVPTTEQVAAGFRRVAVADIADALRTISIGAGRDVTRYALVAFGGAGGQHACAVADALGIDTVLVPPLAGLLCAVGIGAAELTAIAEQAVERPLEPDGELTLRQVAEGLAVEARSRLPGASDAEVLLTAHLRYAGSDTAIAVPLADADTMTAAMAASHREMYAFDPDRELIVESLRAEVVHRSPAPDLAIGPVLRTPPTAVSVHLDGQWMSAPLYAREAVTERVTGPAVITEDGATTVLERGWAAVPDTSGCLVLHRERPVERTGGDTAVDPVRLEIFANRFMAIAEQMGARLAATARSVNIKERLDFSCAVFTGQGQLLANAPHMPVHLGSMGACVRAVLAARADDPRAGDVYASNDPYHGGTHLPDVTVVMPVHAELLGLATTDSADPLFVLAARGHHAEIGGSAPGSMPADSRTIDEEGVVFHAHLLVREGRFLEAETLAALRAGPYPSRAPEINIADLRAQVAAMHAGLNELRRTVAEFGLDVVRAYAGHVLDNAEAAVRAVLDNLTDGQFRYEMDNGAVIMVRVEVDRDARSALVDFTGTSAQLPDNFNAPSSIVTAAVLYVFRTLLDRDIPLNDGCLRPLRIQVPDGSLLAPRPPAAVVAGNVETSQAITGALYGALSVAAEGSGTMNNVTFGNAERQYYETVGSGSGAGPGWAGTPVVQTHMTNSRLTDPEVLETRFPVRVEEFAIRPDSGGAGAHRGGDGARRRLRFTEPVTISLLTGHRRIPPYGMAGGEPGALGRNLLLRADGSTVELAGCDRVDAAAGDALEIHTPGGGGWGKPG